MRRLAIITAVVGTLLSACATARPVPYHWGPYSSSLYGYKKDPTDANLEAHKLVLMQIIQGSDGKTRKVPPGVYAEYGYILVKQGKTEEGFKYLDLEALTFPESKVFVDRVKLQATQPPTTKEQTP